MASVRIGASAAILAGGTANQPVHLVAQGWFTRAFEHGSLWLERSRQRRELRQLGDHMLKDIGLSRADVEAEVAKPFWRA